MNERVTEIQERLAAISTEVESATGDALTALETESRSLLAELDTIQQEAQKRQQLRQSVAQGTAGRPMPGIAPEQPSVEERSANEFVKTHRMAVNTDQTRAVLISGGTLATPTEVSGINDIAGAKVSSIIDMVRVVNCTGMSANRVAYVSEDVGEAATQTEGSAATAKEPTFAYIDITPTSVAVTAQISKQAKKQTPLNYSAKVRDQALLALRKKAASLVTAKLKASALNDTVNATVSTGTSKVGVIDEKTLRNLALALGGDEGIGSGVLFLNKADLVAFGDVRGTNEKKAVYEITPDSANPNTGIIRDGGLSVRYCLNSNLTACAGTAQPAASGSNLVTMIYGDPMALELDLFSDYEIQVSEDFAFTSLMDTIRGDVELGADVVVKKAFISLVIPKAGA